ncbi:hypothetical protein MnTg02_03222 [bacterium MnTg02]|nr:hypothetical protein MnTg02_03222 [bacterium MnTg02]
MAKNQGLARTHGDFPKAQIKTGIAQSLLHQIISPDGSAANGEKNIGAPSFFDSLAQILQSVVCDAEPLRAATCLFDKSGETIGNGRNDLPVPEGVRPGWFQLVPRCQNCDVRPADSGKLIVIHGGRQQEIAGLQDRAFGEQPVAFRKVHALRADIDGKLRILANDDFACFLAGRILLNDDAISALGHRRTGKNTDSLARPERFGEGPSRGRLANHRERNRQCRGIRRAHRITIHRR